MNLNKFYKNRNVLVTGGAGFIGSHIVEQLLELGANVTVLDNLSTGKIENLECVSKPLLKVNSDSLSYGFDKLTTNARTNIYNANLNSTQDSSSCSELKAALTPTINLRCTSCSHCLRPDSSSCSELKAALTPTINLRCTSCSHCVRPDSSSCSELKAALDPHCVRPELVEGYEQNLKSNIKSNVNLIKADIRDFNACLNACKNIETIFHLAAMVSVPESVEKPIECNEVNVTGTLNLLEAAKQNNVKQFVFSSSSAVYGEQNEILSEESNCNPSSPYGLSKLISEQYCKLYSQTVPTICLRYFNVFGNRQDANSAYAAVVVKFTAQMKNNLPITIFGDGKQTRDFINVEQVAQANLKLATLEKSHLNGQSVNIANGKSITLLELVDELKKDFPKYKNEILFKPARNGDIKNSLASIKKLKNLIKN